MLFMLLSSFFILSGAVKTRSLQPLGKMEEGHNASAPDLMSVLASKALITAISSMSRSIPNFPTFALDESEVVVGQPADINLSIDGVNLPGDLDKLKAVLIRPNGKEEPLKCEMDAVGKLVLSFTPEESGKHLIDVLKNRLPVNGSPFEIMVKEFGETSNEVVVGRPTDINLSIDGVNVPGDLDKLKAELMRPNGKKEPLECKMDAVGNLVLSFTPEESGKHLINVLKNRRPVTGSPFMIMVKEFGETSNWSVVGSPFTLDLDIPEIDLPQDLRNMKATLTSPNGKIMPLPCASSPDNTLELNFTPTMVGKYLVDVTCRSRPVKGSPFEIMVQESAETGNKNVVGEEVYVNLEVPGLNLPRDFKKLEGTLARPETRTEEPLELDFIDDGTIGAKFMPQKAGIYSISIKKHGRQVLGSPFDVIVEDGGTSEKVSVDDGTVHVGFQVPGIKLPEDLKYLKALLTLPNGQLKYIEVKAGPNNTLVFDFKQEGNGEYVIGITKNGNHVGDSPYKVAVP